MNKKKFKTVLQKIHFSWRKGLALLMLIFICFIQVKAQRVIVAIGDSNGASEIGWVNQLKSMWPQDSIFNYSISGNTIGFDNLENEKLNTLKNIEVYLENAVSRSPLKSINDVVILLGTNDCKTVFNDRGEEVLQNLRKLIEIIQAKNNLSSTVPNIFIASPPPIADDSLLIEKYYGGNLRLQKLLPGYMAISLESGSYFIDNYNELSPLFDELHTDGIHLNEKGSKMVAASISGFLDKTTKISWDDEEQTPWPKETEVVEIPSPLDGEIQKAYFFKSSKPGPQPLIVSLHSWSGDYTQKDDLLKEVMEKDWNYIHPDFRGVNNTPKSCGSKYAIDDIEQAISFAIENANVDIQNIHVIGVSGGGYATLYTFMKSKHNIASFSAWVPISDIEAWYYQSAGRQNKYAGHMLTATESVNSVLNIEEARLRSPMFMNTPRDARASSSLNIYAGVHDGYTGSVPISQSLKFYNKIIKDFGTDESELISDQKILDLVTMQNLPDYPAKKVGDREIIFYRKFKNTSITIFEGTHEMLTNVALKLLSVEHEN